MNKTDPVSTFKELLGKADIEPKHTKEKKRLMGIHGKGKQPGAPRRLLRE